MCRCACVCCVVTGETAGAKRVVVGAVCSQLATPHAWRVTGPGSTPTRHRDQTGKLSGDAQANAISHRHCWHVPGEMLGVCAALVMRCMADAWMATCACKRQVSFQVSSVSELVYRIHVHAGHAPP